MKTTMKRILVLALTCLMVIGSIAGCKSKTSATSMFDVAKKVMEMEQYNFTTTVAMDMQGQSFEAELTGRTDGDATAISVKVSVSGMSFEFEDVLIYADNTLFINAKTIEDSLSAFLEQSGISFADYGVTSDWIAFSYDASAEKDTTLTNSILDGLDEAFKDVIKEEDGTYKISISSADEMKTLLDAAKTMMEDNADEWAGLIAEAYSASNSSDVLSTFIANLKTEVLASAAEAGVEITEEDLDSIISEYNSSLEEASDITEDTIKEAMDEVTTSIDSAKEELTDDTFGEGKVDISTSAKDGKYSMSMTLDAPATDEYSTDTAITVNSEFEEDKDVKIDVPSKDDAVALEKVLAPIIVSYYSSMMMYEDYEYDDTTVIE